MKLISTFSNAENFLRQFETDFPFVHSLPIIWLIVVFAEFTFFYTSYLTGKTLTYLTMPWCLSKSFWNTLYLKQHRKQCKNIAIYNKKYVKYLLYTFKNIKLLVSCQTRTKETKLLTNRFHYQAARKLKYK